MTHSDVIIGHVVTSSVKLHQEAPSSIDGCVNELDTLVNTVTETTPAVSTELCKLLSDLKEKLVHATLYCQR